MNKDKEIELLKLKIEELKLQLELAKIKEQIPIQPYTPPYIPPMEPYTPSVPYRPQAPLWYGTGPTCGGHEEILCSIITIE